MAMRGNFSLKQIDTNLEQRQREGMENAVYLKQGTCMKQVGPL